MASVGNSTFVVTHPDELVDRVKPMTHDIAEGMAELTRSRTPTETGRLAGGWKVELVDGTRWVVTNDVPYARYVEFGTKYVAPAAMLGQAAAQARARYV